MKQKGSSRLLSILTRGSPTPMSSTLPVLEKYPDRKEEAQREQNLAAELAPPPSPEQIRTFFAEMSAEDGAKMANEAISALEGATTRQEAEKAVIQMAPFFLDVLFPKLSEELKTKDKRYVGCGRGAFRVSCRCSWHRRRLRR